MGPNPTISSLSLGDTATFEMRRMRNCWPCVSESTEGGAKDDGVDRHEPERSFECKHGDLLVMRGDTQDAWHHRVPTKKGRRPRVNINFRYILPNSGVTGIEGQATYYKYMVYGDSKKEWAEGKLKFFRYKELLKKHGSLLGFAAKAEGGGGKKRLFELRKDPGSKVTKLLSSTSKNKITSMFKATSSSSTVTKKETDEERYLRHHSDVDKAIWNSLDEYLRNGIVAEWCGN